MIDYCTCSPDKILGIYIGDLCKKHDEVYEEGCCWYHKIGSDLMLGLRIFLRGIKHLFGGFALICVAPIYTLVTLILGYIVWRKKHGIIFFFL